MAQVYLQPDDPDPVRWKARFSNMMYKALQDCYLRSRVYKQVVSRLECLVAAAPPQEALVKVRQSAVLLACVSCGAHKPALRLECLVAAAPPQEALVKVRHCQRSVLLPQLGVTSSN